MVSRKLFSNSVFGFLILPPSLTNSAACRSFVSSSAVNGRAPFWGFLPGFAPSHVAFFPQDVAKDMVAKINALLPQMKPVGLSEKFLYLLNSNMYLIPQKSSKLGLFTNK